MTSVHGCVCEDAPSAIPIAAEDLPSPQINTDWHALPRKISQLVAHSDWQQRRAPELLLIYIQATAAERITKYADEPNFS